LINKKELNVLTKHIGGIGLSFLFNQDAFEFREDINDDFPLNIQDEIRLRVHVNEFPETRREEKIFDSKSTWSLYRSKKKYILYDRSLELDSLPSKLLILESDFESGEIFIRNDGSSQNLFSDPLGYPLNQILMIILLSLRKGVLVHSCGIDDRGCGYLFLGNSGHGKSTMAKLWSESGATVLNDDRIIVREKNGQFWMYGTPWHGDFKELSLKGLPIRKIFFLRHGEKNSSVRKKGAEAVSMLLTRSFPPLWDKKGMEFTLKFCAELAQKVPCYELGFVPDESVLDFIEEVRFQ